MYLVDTNILIYHFNKNIPEKSKSKLANIFKEYFNVSIITRMEFLGFKGHTEESFKKAEIFLSYANVLGFDNEIADMVIDIKRNKSIKLPDAIIASTASKNDFTLVTRNIDDFKGIDIKIYNPFE